MSRCHPSHSHYTAETDTCFSPDQLETIAVHSGLLRRLSNKSNVAGINLYILAGMLHEHFGTQMGQEAQWLHMNQHIPRKYANAFRATWPGGKENSLLETYDIWTVLSQYEHKYPFFRFFGVHPVDFSQSVRGGKCISSVPELCGLTADNFGERTGGRTDFAIVVNMDPHTQPGSHWAALYGCIDRAKTHRYGLFYFDSIGRPPPPIIRAFMSQFAGSSGMPLKRNKVQRQFGGVQCGLYSISFVVNCVSTTMTYNNICNDEMLNDRSMFNARDIVIRSK
jgi:hypothetical protein